MQTTKEEWFYKAQEAVLHFDASDAYKILRDWTVVNGTKVSEKQSNQPLEILRKELLFTAFVLLPADLAVLVMKEYLTDFLKSSVELLDPVEKIESRIKIAGYGAYDQERELMKKAVLVNQEIIGRLPVKEWIKRFEKTLNLENQDSASLFFRQDSEIAGLSKNNQALLKILISLYDKWLYGDVISVFDVAVMNRGSMGPDNARRTEDANERRIASGNIVSLPLLQALSKYENLGNQLITQERIRVKSQVEPVRPSLLYWLKYYRDDIGVGHHDSVQRGQFLFRSENGKRLSAEERERLSLILKSVEEDFPLAIDTERQEIVFPVFSGVTVGGQDQPRALPANARMMRGPAFVDNGAGDERAKKFIPASNPVLQYSDAGRSDRTVATQGAASGLRMGRGMHFSNLEQTKTVPSEPGAMSFSASHIFPAEKEGTHEQASVEQARMPQTQKPAPRPVPTPAPKPNPFHIHPVSLGKGVGKESGIKN